MKFKNKNATRSSLAINSEESLVLTLFTTFIHNEVHTIKFRISFRIPEVIPVSTCRCSGCLIPNNPDSEEGDRENTAFSSVLVRVPVQIFDRHLNTTRNFTIDAGCICIKPSTEIVKK